MKEFIKNMKSVVTKEQTKNIAINKRPEVSSQEFIKNMKAVVTKDQTKDIATNKRQEVSSQPSINSISQVSPSEDAFDPFSPSDEREKFTRCHGQCVQKFCLPVGNLNTYDKCLEKCRGICEEGK